MHTQQREPTDHKFICLNIKREKSGIKYGNSQRREGIEGERVYVCIYVYLEFVENIYFRSDIDPTPDAFKVLCLAVLCLLSKSGPFPYNTDFYLPIQLLVMLNRPMKNNSIFFIYVLYLIIIHYKIAITFIFYIKSIYFILNAMESVINDDNTLIYFFRILGRYIL